MQWIGLTGGIGSGKSTFAEIAREHGYPVISADAVVHEILLRSDVAKKSIRRRFGDEVFGEGDKIDRLKLGKKVFANEQDRLDLEKILHPLVKQEVARLKGIEEKRGCAICIYEVPLLFEKSMQGQFDEIILITAEPDIRLSRLVGHRKMAVEEARHRISAQLGDEIKKAAATYVIQNNGDLTDFREKSVAALAELKNKNLKG